jgi:hypothetical protein
MPGDERYERTLHAAFADLRIRGEWFRFEGRLVDFIKALPPMPLAFSSVPRSREHDPELDADPIVKQATYRKYWKRRLSLISDAVQLVGLNRFARFVGTSSPDICNAVTGRNRRIFRAEWMAALMLVAPPHIVAELQKQEAEFLATFAISNGEIRERESKHSPALLELMDRELGQ